MNIVSVMYPEAEGKRFDLTYYMNKHMPMVASHGQDLGLQSYHVERGVGAPGGGKAAYRVIAHLKVSSVQAFASGMEKHGREIMGDIPNYTDIQPVIQFSEVVD
ncbi:MAG: EthD family reductase [Alphaproteobacteria bacterium]|nr:EthD family reductase [Alphaproteobacteria bacterium]